MKKLWYGQIKSFAKGHKEILRSHSDNNTAPVLWTEMGPHMWQEHNFFIDNFKVTHLSYRNIKSKALPAHMSKTIL